MIFLLTTETVQKIWTRTKSNLGTKKRKTWNRPTKAKAPKVQTQNKPRHNSLIAYRRFSVGGMVLMNRCWRKGVNGNVFVEWKLWLGVGGTVLKDHCW